MTISGKIHALGLIASLGLIAATTSAQAAAQETDGLLHDERKLVGFPMPKSWKFSDIKSSPITTKHGDLARVLAFTARTIEFGTLYVDIYLLNGSAVTNRLQAIHERQGKLPQGDAHNDEYVISLDPIAHSHYTMASDPDVAHLLVHRRASGRAMSVTFSLPAKHLAKARPTLLNLANKAVSNTQLWPEKVAAYEYENESGVTLGFLPDIRKKHRKVVRKLVKATVKDFIKTHGQPMLNADEPLVVYFERDGAKRADLLDDQAATLDHGRSSGMRRIVVPVLATDRGAAARDLIGYLYEYMLDTIYPTGMRWAMLGEESLARMKSNCRKALPYVPESWHPRMKSVPFTLDQVAKQSNLLRYEDAAAFQVYFRLGPAKARKAYTEFLSELRTGTEPEAAARKLINRFGGIDGQNSVRDAVAKKTKLVRGT